MYCFVLCYIYIYRYTCVYTYYVYIRLSRLYPILSSYMIMMFFPPHLENLETHLFLYVTANQLRTVSCTLLESRLGDLQRFHSPLSVAWLRSETAQVDSRHPETTIMAVETMTGHLVSQIGRYMCTLVYTLYLYTYIYSNSQKGWKSQFSLF